MSKKIRSTLKKDEKSKNDKIDVSNSAVKIKTTKSTLNIASNFNKLGSIFRLNSKKDKSMFNLNKKNGPETKDLRLLNCKVQLSKNSSKIEEINIPVELSSNSYHEFLKIHPEEILIKKVADKSNVSSKPSKPSKNKIKKSMIEVELLPDSIIRKVESYYIEIEIYTTEFIKKTKKKCGIKKKLKLKPVLNHDHCKIIFFDHDSHNIENSNLKISNATVFLNIFKEKKKFPVSININILHEVDLDESKIQDIVKSKLKNIFSLNNTDNYYNNNKYYKITNTTEESINNKIVKNNLRTKKNKAKNDKKTIDKSRFFKKSKSTISCLNSNKNKTKISKAVNFYWSVYNLNNRKNIESVLIQNSNYPYDNNIENKSLNKKNSMNPKNHKVELIPKKGLGYDKNKKKSNSINNLKKNAVNKKEDSQKLNFDESDVIFESKNFNGKNYIDVLVKSKSTKEINILDTKLPKQESQTISNEDINIKPQIEDNKTFFNPNLLTINDHSYRKEKTIFRNSSFSGLSQAFKEEYFKNKDISYNYETELPTLLNYKSNKNKLENNYFKSIRNIQSQIRSNKQSINKQQSIDVKLKTRNMLLERKKPLSGNILLEKVPYSDFLNNMSQEVSKYYDKTK